MGKNNLKSRKFVRILLNAKSVYCDSVIFSFHFHRHPTFSLLTSQLFELLDRKKITVITSCLSYMEILSLKDLENAPEKRLLIREFFLSQTNLQMNQVDASLVEKAAYVRRTAGLKAVDALQLATAELSLAKVFLTNDKDFRRISPKQFPIIFLDDYVS